MQLFHQYLGIGLTAVFAAIGIWGIGAWLRNRDPGRAFWGLLAGAQVGIGIQFIAGAVLFAMGGRRPWLHYAYGLFPILLLIVAHRMSRRLPGLEWVGFSIACLISSGLLLRAYLTGLV